jgi:carbon storage regulator
MLVLSRHASEKIMIGDDIVITVNWIKGNKVSLGIEAPGKLNIRRSEVPFKEKDHGKEAD